MDCICLWCNIPSWVDCRNYLHSDIELSPTNIVSILHISCFFGVSHQLSSLRNRVSLFCFKCYSSLAPRIIFGSCRCSIHVCWMNKWTKLVLYEIDFICSQYIAKMPFNQTSHVKWQICDAHWPCRVMFECRRDKFKCFHLARHMLRPMMMKASDNRLWWYSSLW